MPENAFIGKTQPPTEAELAAALGPALPHWRQLLADLTKEWGANLQEWNSYSPKAGWSLRVKRKDRTIVWLSASTGCFTAAIILGEKAVRAARQSPFSDELLPMLNEGKKYPEGTAVRFVVKTAKDLKPIDQFAAIKVAN